MQAQINALSTQLVAVLRDARAQAITEIEEFSAAQATWLEQTTLEDRAKFLADQQALHAAWKQDMQALIDGQTAALQQVVMRTVALLRTQSQLAPPANRRARWSSQLLDVALSLLAMTVGMVLIGGLALVGWHYFGQ